MRDHMRIKISKRPGREKASFRERERERANQTRIPEPPSSTFSPVLESLSRCHLAIGTLFFFFFFSCSLFFQSSMCKFLLQFFGFGLLFGLTQCIKLDRHLPKCFKVYGGLGRVGCGKISIWSKMVLSVLYNCLMKCMRERDD